MRRVIFAAFCLTSLLFAQGFERPVPYDINSDFGPRNLASYDWHRGLDYVSPMWTSVEVVEDGNINEINYQPGSEGGGWYIRVQGDSATWTYMHLFTDSYNPISPDNRYEARMARLVNPQNPQETYDRYVFIFWIDRNNNISEKVLTPYFEDYPNGLWIRARPGDPGYDPNNPYILDQTGNRILAQGSVANREVVAPSGESGAGGIHLHVGAHRDYRYDINPLYYIIHPEPHYTLSIIQHPPVDAVLYHRPGAPEALQLNERIRVNINSTQGLDLDRGFVYFFKPSEPRVFDDVHRYAKITYGGLPPDIPFPEPFPNRITLEGEANRGVLTRSGVNPQGGDPGNDDFYFIGGFSESGFQFNTKINTPGTGTARIHSEARFSDGPKNMVIRSHSIRWNFEDYYFDTEREDISIDNFKPYVARVRIEQVLKTKEGERGIVKYEAHWPESPQSNTDLGELVPDTEGYCRTGLGITVTVEFSEDMNTMVLPILKVEFPDGSFKQVTGIFTWLDNRTYQVITNNDFLETKNKGKATLHISGAKDLAGNENDGNPRTIAYRNASGNWQQAESIADNNYHFWIDPPPQVKATDPPSNNRAMPEDIDIYKKITVAFNRTMDTISVRQALEIINIDNDSSEVIIKDIEWQPGDSVLLIIAYDPVVLDDTVGFDFYTNYEVKILGTAADTSGQTLDGNQGDNPDGKSEGSPEDDYVFSFKTRNPACSLTVPGLTKIKINNTEIIKCIVKNNELRKIGVKLQRIGGNSSNWTVSDPVPDTLVVRGLCDTFTRVAVANAGNPGWTSFKVTAKTYDTTLTAIACVWAYSPNQQYSEPFPPPVGCDENYSISSHMFPSPWILNPHAKTGIFLSGYAECMGHLLGKFNISTAIVLDNFTILGAHERPLSDLDVLIIPTGGLIPYANLPFYRDKFAEFVDQGGTLVCLAQSYGEIFEALPGSPGGYGWAEDQSCHAFACYLNLWDTFLAGQDDIIYDGNMDGYLTQFPDNSEQFLIRIANGYPGFIRYPYGQGEVILTTGYTDYAYRIRAEFKDEAALIRDLATSYVSLGSIPEYYEDSSVTLVDIPIYYPVYEDSIPANRAEIITYYPNRESLSVNEIVLSSPMVPGDTQIVSLPSLTAPCSLGIYPLMFTLFQDTIPVTEEEFSTAFAVKCSIPVGNYNLGDFQIWATVEAESAAYGAPVEFTIYARNNTANTFPGMLIIGDSIRWQSTPVIYDDTFNISIPPETLISFPYERLIETQRSIIFDLNDTTETRVAWFRKYIRVHQPRVRITISCDSAGYYYNSTAQIEAKFVPNYDAVDSFAIIICQTFDWMVGDTIYEIRDTITYMRDDTSSYSFSFFLDESLAVSSYLIEAQSFLSGMRTGNNRIYFSLNGADIELTLLSDSIITGNDTTKFILGIDPASYLCKDAKLEYSVVHSGTLGTVIVNELLYDTLRNLDTLIAPFAISQDSMYYGWYKFKYNFTDFNTINGSYWFSHRLNLDLLNDYTPCRWGDTLNIGFYMKNIGDFDTPLWIVMDIENPTGNFYDSTMFDLNLDTDTTIYYQVHIDSGISQGAYDIFARVWSGNDKIQLYGQYYVLEPTPPEIMIAVDTSYYNVGDTVMVLLYNAGEKGGELRLDSIWLQDLRKNIFPLDTARFSIPGGEFAFYEFIVPEIMEGPYLLNIKGIVEGYGFEIHHRTDLQINGIWADLILSTTKDIYLTHEDMIPQVNCVNSEYQFVGNMNLLIAPYSLNPGDLIFLPDGDLWPITGAWYYAKGCTVKDYRAALLDWDKLYEQDRWTLRRAGDRAGSYSCSIRDILKDLLETEKEGGEKGDAIHEMSVASNRDELYVAFNQGGFCIITGPYPTWENRYEFTYVHPHELAMDDSYFYLGDWFYRKIRKISRISGNIVAEWDAPTDAGGLGIFGSYLYVVDQGNHCIVQTDLDGHPIAIFGADSLVAPHDLAVDEIGYIYVSDLTKRKVFIFNGSGNCISTKGDGKFLQIAVDTKGYLYGADIDSTKMAKYDENGQLIEWYQLSSFPSSIERITSCDTLIHLTKIYWSSGGFYWWVRGDVVENYGRNKGVTQTEEIWIDGLKYLTRFEARDDEESGSIDYSFAYMDFNTYEWHYLPIDSLTGIDLENYGFPPVLFRAVITKEVGASPEIERMDLDYLAIETGGGGGNKGGKGIEPVWQDSFPISFSPYDSVLIERNAGLPPDTGGYIFWGKADLDNGQRYPTFRYHHFFVNDNLLALGIRTDKNLYYTNEEVKTEVIAVNNSDSVHNDITVQLFKDEDKVLDTLFVAMPPQSSCTLSVSLSDSLSFTFTGLLLRTGFDTLETVKDIVVEYPDIYSWTDCPYSVDHHQFNVKTELNNWWRREVEVILRTSLGDSVLLDTIMLYPEQSRIIEYQFTLTQDETLYTEILKPTEYTEEHLIRFGEKLEVQIDSVVSSENSVLIPYSVVNIGEFDCAFDMHLAITDTIGTICDSITYSNFLQIDDSLQGEWGVSLDFGQYQVSWTAVPESSTVILTQGTTSISITLPNIVAVDSIILLPECDSLGSLIFDIPVRNNSANAFYGNIGLYASFINETWELELEPFDIDTVRFVNGAVLNEGYYQLTANVLQGGEIIFERTDSLYFNAELVIDSLPQALTFNIGDTAEVFIKTRNKGTAQGDEQLRFEFADFCQETRLITLVPGESRVDTFLFYLPEDLEEKTYYASVWLGTEEFVLPINILGYKIIVNASLNQVNFMPGDTVILDLDIENQNERNLKGFSVANYNGEVITNDFLLSGYVRDIDLSNPEFIKASGENGVYISAILWPGNFDSLKITPQGTGTFGFYTRIVESDSVHYSNWYDDSIIIEQAQAFQIKVQFSDTVSTLERVNLKLFDSLTIRDTIIEQFYPVDLIHEFSFLFEPIVNLMFYGIYTESGRGLWLSTIHIFEANDTCNIITNNQVYDMGDTVFATVQSPFSGELVWSSDFHPFGTISDSLWIDSLNNQFELVLPEELVSGTYAIDFKFYVNGDTLQGFSASQSFDVRGYQVAVFDCRLDTNEYQVNDSMFIRFKLNSSKQIPLIAKLRFVQNYQWYDALCDTVDVDSGFNVIDLATMVSGLERGPALLSYSFSKDSIFLAYSSEGFMVYIPDSLAPIAQFVGIPENTYNPNIDHTVRIVATDETRIYDTLYYHNGITQNKISYQTKLGDTLIYEIPSQPRGTNIAYYIVLEDSFGNLTRLPEIDYHQFWVLSPLPPSDCETDTINQNIEISWGNPTENLIYNSGYPYEPKSDSIAVRFTPQYLPAELNTVKLFVEKTTPDTVTLNLGFYSVDQGMPGVELYPPQEIMVTEEGANWVDVPIDSGAIEDEMFVVFSGEDIDLYGDGNSYAYRTLIRDEIWTADTSFGNLLAQAGFFYEPESTFYRVMREDSMQFIVIADSLTDKTFIDSTVSGERRFRYLVQTNYMHPDLKGTSPILTQIYDYTPPVFGDSIAVLEYVSGYLIACQIFDGIGVAVDSLVYNGIPTTHDSIINDLYWYTVPIAGQTIAYYFTAEDSAGNSVRNPDTGYFYIIPHIPEGFSGHISKDTTWAIDILIKGDVWVDSGVTLTINAGVNVKFMPNIDDEHAGIDTTRAEFIIQGDLALCGNDSTYVFFTSNASQPEIGDWYGIRFENPDSSVKLEYTEVEYAEIGLHCDLNKPFQVKYCKIEFCNTGVNSASKFTKITDSEFSNNQDGAVINDGKLNMVKRCNFIDNLTGLEINGEREKKQLSSYQNFKTSGRDLPQEIDPEFSVYVEDFRDKGQKALIFDNFFSGNDTGLVFTDQAGAKVKKNEIIDNLIGVYITDDACPNLGKAMSGENLFIARSDTLDSLKSYAVYNNTMNDILAEGNWWGTNDEDSIAVIIWDYYDDNMLGIVDYKPFRLSEASAAGGASEQGGGTQSGSEVVISEIWFELAAIARTNNVIISYCAPADAQVSIEIYDITGRLAKKLSPMKSMGPREITINCNDLAGGVYLVRFKAADYLETEKIIILK